MFTRKRDLTLGRKPGELKWHDKNRRPYEENTSSKVKYVTDTPCPKGCGGHIVLFLSKC